MRIACDLLGTVMMIVKGLQQMLPVKCFEVTLSLSQTKALVPGNLHPPFLLQQPDVEQRHRA
jgi:hypothetical protein